MKKAKKIEKGIPTESQVKAKKRVDKRETIGNFESRSEPGLTHHVYHMPGSGEITCTCKGFTFNGECRHTKTVIGQNIDGIRMTLERERIALKAGENDYARKVQKSIDKASRSRG